MNGLGAGHGVGRSKGLRAWLPSWCAASAARWSSGRDAGCTAARAPGPAPRRAAPSRSPHWRAVEQGLRGVRVGASSARAARRSVTGARSLAPCSLRSSTASETSTTSDPLTCCARPRPGVLRGLSRLPQRARAPPRRGRSRTALHARASQGVEHFRAAPHAREVEQKPTRELHRASLNPGQPRARWLRRGDMDCREVSPLGLL